MEKAIKKPGVEITYLQVGAILGILLSVAVCLIIFYSSKPRQVVKILMPEDTQEDGTVEDISLLKRYVPLYEPLRRWTARVEGKNLVVQYKRDWAACIALGIIIPILIFIGLLVSGDLLDRRSSEF